MEFSAKYASAAIPLRALMPKMQEAYNDKDMLSKITALDNLISQQRTSFLAEIQKGERGADASKIDKLAINKLFDSVSTEYDTHRKQFKTLNEIQSNLEKGMRSLEKASSKELKQTDSIPARQHKCIKDLHDVGNNNNVPVGERLETMKLKFTDADNQELLQQGENTGFKALIKRVGDFLTGGWFSKNGIFGHSPAEVKQAVSENFTASDTPTAGFR